MAKTRPSITDETAIDEPSETEEVQPPPPDETATLLDVSLVEARILVDCILGACNQIVMLSPEQVKHGLRANWLDTTPEAIAAAKS